MASPSAGDTHAETGNARVLNPLSSYIHLTGSLGSDIGAQCRNEQRQESSEPNTATSRNWEDKSARPKTTQNLMQPVSDGLSVDFIARHTSDETLRRRANSNDRESIPLSDERMPENFYNRNWERAQPNHTQTQHPVDPQPLPRPSPVSNRLSADFIALHTQDKTLQHEQNDNKVKISNTTAPTDQKKAEDDDNSPDVATVLAQVLRNKRVQTKNEVEVQRNNPSSPLHSVKSFEELPLSEELRRGIYDMGFNKPSKIQETALWILLADPPNNMIAQSQSGTGKTTAFVLPMLSRVDATQNFTQVICLSPTYELSLQTGQVAEKMSKFCPEIKIGYAVREVSVSPGHKVTDHILFGTPGTMLDWICKHKLVDQRKIKMFVLDEADVMIAGQGYQDQSIGIYKTLTKDCQMLLFSATFDDEVMKFANEVVPDPIVIRLRPEEESLDNIKQFYVECRDQEDKQQALSNMYAVLSIGQCIVFCETRESASWLETKMTAEGHSVAVLSEEMTEEERLAVWNRFRDGKARLLIATNVCARGIDVEQVTLVVNYDMPVEPSGEPDFETYLHRIGRTGRFGKNGNAVNFIDCSKALNILKKIEEHFGRKISLLETNDVEELEKLN